MILKNINISFIIFMFLHLKRENFQIYFEIIFLTFIN